MFCSQSSAADARFLEETRRYYEAAARAWGPWRQSFRALVEDDLQLDFTEVAYTNIAKCRQSLALSAPDKLMRHCVADLPAAKPSVLVEAIKPVAVIARVLDADPRRGVMRWTDGGASWSPIVCAFQGRNGVNAQGVSRREWRPGMVADIKEAQASAKTSASEALTDRDDEVAQLARGARVNL